MPNSNLCYVRPSSLDFWRRGNFGSMKLCSGGVLVIAIEDSPPPGRRIHRSLIVVIRRIYVVEEIPDWEGR